MSILGLDPAERKAIPVYSGVVKYFPRALAAVAKLSKAGNDQHNPGKPLHWDRSKSGDELDAMMRHVIDEDWDAVAWRALAHCEKMLEAQDTPVAPDVEEPLFVRAPSQTVNYLKSLQVQCVAGVGRAASGQWCIQCIETGTNLRHYSACRWTRKEAYDDYIANHNAK